MKNNILKYVCLLILPIFIISCGGGRSSGEIVPEYVDSFKYAKLSCKDLVIEMTSLSQLVNESQSKVDNKKEQQGEKNVAAFLLFWPALFLVDDNSIEAQRYSKLKGEFEAITKELKKKDCK